MKRKKEGADIHALPVTNPYLVVLTKTVGQAL